MRTDDYQGGVRSIATRWHGLPLTLPAKRSCHAGLSRYLPQRAALRESPSRGGPSQRVTQATSQENAVTGPETDPQSKPATAKPARRDACVRGGHAPRPGFNHRSAHRASVEGGHPYSLLPARSAPSCAGASSSPGLRNHCTPWLRCMPGPQVLGTSPCLSRTFRSLRPCLRDCGRRRVSAACVTVRAER
jgi:hypothetical protein